MKIDFKFFKDLELYFYSQVDGVRLILTQEKVTEEDDEFGFDEESETSIFQIEQILKKYKAKLNWLKCELTSHQTSNSVVKLCNFFSGCLDVYNQIIKDFERKLEAQEKNTVDVTKSMEKLVKNFDKEKNDILEKCALLINTKKSKIRELEDKLSTMIMRGSGVVTQKYGTGKKKFLIFFLRNFLIFFQAYQNTVDDDESIGLSCFSNMSKFSNLSQMSHASQIDFQRAKKMRIGGKREAKTMKKKQKKRGKMEEENIINEVKSRSFRASSVRSEGKRRKSVSISEESCSVFELGDEFEKEEIGKKVTIFERIRLRKLKKKNQKKKKRI